MESHFAVFLAPDEADGETSTQFAASSLVANPAVEAGAQDVKLGFAHCALRNHDIPPSNSHLKSSSSIRTTRMPANASRSFGLSFTPVMRTMWSNFQLAAGSWCRRG
jgi:hypothetical protein